MLRSTFRQSTLLRLTTCRYPIIATRSYSIIDSAKKVISKDIKYAEEAAEKINKKTGEVLSEGIDLAQTVKHRHDAISKVRKNEKGYKDLEDKGSKVESEQCRPDDGL